MVNNINLDGFETIGNGIFLYKNFLSTEVTKGIKIVVPSYAYQVIKVPIDKVVD